MESSADPISGLDNKDPGVGAAGEYRGRKTRGTSAKHKNIELPVHL